jgi:hypothetical protein
MRQNTDEAEKGAVGFGCGGCIEHCCWRDIHSRCGNKAACVELQKPAQLRKEENRIRINPSKNHTANDVNFLFEKGACIGGPGGKVCLQ